MAKDSTLEAAMTQEKSEVGNQLRGLGKRIDQGDSATSSLDMKLETMRMEIGQTMVTETGKLGEVCDLAAEVCICEAGAACAPPPLQLRSSDYAAAGRAVAHAWAIVGVSVVGALLGTAAQRGGALLLKRNRYRHVPDAAGTTWPGSKDQHDT